MMVVLVLALAMGMTTVPLWDAPSSAYDYARTGTRRASVDECCIDAVDQRVKRGPPLQDVVRKGEALLVKRCLQGAHQLEQCPGYALARLLLSNGGYQRPLSWVGADDEALGCCSSSSRAPDEVLDVACEQVLCGPVWAAKGISSGVWIRLGCKHFHLRNLRMPPSLPPPVMSPGTHGRRGRGGVLQPREVNPFSTASSIEPA